MKVLLLFGTRPEAIKMAPIWRELRSRPTDFNVRCGVTGQHRDLLDQVNRSLGLEPDFDLDIMMPGQALEDVVLRALDGLRRVLEREAPDCVLVQGDTTTTLVGALAAFYRRIPVGHVEAGLRTEDRYNPFPEEVNRRMTSVLASLHFAPTAGARDNLLKDGVAADDILVTGNTVIDALHMCLDRNPSCDAPLLMGLDPNKRMILVTAHRRESHGEPIREIASALKAVAERHHDVRIVFPVHPHPEVAGPVHDILGGIPNIVLTAPLDYVTFVHLMKRSSFLLTDSGGLQEEGPGLGKPVLVMRDVTERPEAVAAGAARVVGRTTDSIVAAVERLLQDRELYDRMASAGSPYGDGRASRRIADAILNRWAS
jgi:UDP-N-acetylglucosamine 2-epimerase (non-hydrolysing)